MQVDQYALHLIHTGHTTHIRLRPSSVQSANCNILLSMYHIVLLLQRCAIFDLHCVQKLSLIVPQR